MKGIKCFFFFFWGLFLVGDISHIHLHVDVDGKVWECISYLWTCLYIRLRTSSFSISIESRWSWIFDGNVMCIVSNRIEFMGQWICSLFSYWIIRVDYKTVYKTGRMYSLWVLRCCSVLNVHQSLNWFAGSIFIFGWLIMHSFWATRDSRPVRHKFP